MWSDSQIITDKDLSDAIINRHQSNDCTDVILSYNDKVDITQLTEQYQKNYVEAANAAS